MASTLAQTSLDAAKSGNGTTIDFAAGVSRVSMVLAKSGTVTGGVVVVEASHDGTNWVKRNAFNAAQAPLAFDSLGGAYRYWRASVRAAVAGGGAVTATFMEAG